jgi:hypothetical protein
MTRFACLIALLPTLLWFFPVAPEVAQHLLYGHELTALRFAAEEDRRLANRLILWSPTCGDQETSARIQLFAQWHREPCSGHRFDSTHA